MEFWQYSGEVGRYIRFTPDRPEVEREILAHLEDRRDAYISRGFERKEAEQKAVAAMGNPEEIGRALDRLHSPVLGWFQIWFGRAVCLLAIVSILMALPWAVEKARDFWDYGGKVPSMLHTFWEDWILWGEQGPEVVFDIKPDAVWHYGSYTFSIERAAVIRNAEGEELTLYYIMKAVTPNPWPRWSEFREWLYAEDDLGNYHPCWGESENYTAPYFSEHESGGNPVKTGPFVSWYEMWVGGIDPEASEVTICFDHYGEKAISLTIPMRGEENRE